MGSVTKKKPADNRSKPARSYRARADGQVLKSQIVGALPIVNDVLDRMRLSDFLDSYLPAPDSRSKVTTRQGLLVLLRNILVSREPMYALGEWAESYASDLLGLGARQVKALNDDCVGRCLERLFDADYSSMALALSTHVVKEFEIQLDQLHNDSTTITFVGSYEDAEPGATQRCKPTLAITHGHNKDHRPDLKQLLFILTVARDGGVPIHFSAADGNVTDDQTHRDTWDLMCRLAGRRDFLYVADSKLATTKNMTHVHQGGGRFVTVLPRTRRESKEFRKLVQEEKVTWRELWIKTDEDGEFVDTYVISEQPATTSEGYRLLWIHSVGKHERDARTRSKRIENGLGDLATLRGRLRSPQTRFRQRARVAEAVEKILDDRACREWIGVEVREIRDESYRQAKRGRPGKGTQYIREVRLRFDLEYWLKEDAIRKEALTDGIFPLVTNASNLDELEVLQAYKDQPRVERRFSNLKSDFEVAPIYLKNVARIEALLCVYFLALLTQALIERELRKAMAEQGVRSIAMYPEGRACSRPCTRRILDLFENIQRHELTGAGAEPLMMVTELSAIQRQVLRLLGVSERSYGRRAMS
jgi:transposase